MLDCSIPRREGLPRGDSDEDVSRAFVFARLPFVRRATRARGVQRLLCTDPTVETRLKGRDPESRMASAGKQS